MVFGVVQSGRTRVGGCSLGVVHFGGIGGGVLPGVVVFGLMCALAGTWFAEMSICVGGGTLAMTGVAVDVLAEAFGGAMVRVGMAGGVGTGSTLGAGFGTGGLTISGVGVSMIASGSLSSGCIPIACLHFGKHSLITGVGAALRECRGQMLFLSQMTLSLKKTTIGIGDACTCTNGSVGVVRSGSHVCWKSLRPSSVSGGSGTHCIAGCVDAG